MPIKAGPFLLRDDVDMAKVLRERYVPLVHKPSRTLRNGKSTYHCLIPANWPECVDEAGDFEHRAQSIMNTLEKTGVGEPSLMTQGRESDTWSYMTIGVDNTKVGPVGVCLFDRPIDVEGEDSVTNDLRGILVIRYGPSMKGIPLAVYSVQPEAGS